jgi:hypothetical protein
LGHGEDALFRGLAGDVFVAYHVEPVLDGGDDAGVGDGVEGA